MKSQPVRGHHPKGPDQSHAWFMLQSDEDLESLLQLSQDKHASGVVDCDRVQPAVAGATADDFEAEFEVETEAFHESEVEEAPQPDMRTICALRRSQDQYDIDFFVSYCAFIPARIMASDMHFMGSLQVVQGHPCDARDDPADHSHPRHVTSRIVGRNVQLVQGDVD
jgi:hypothetical protein